MQIVESRFAIGERGIVIHQCIDNFGEKQTEGIEDFAVSGVANNLGNCVHVEHNHRLFYAACLLSTADLRMPEGMAIPIDERAAAMAVGLIVEKGVAHPLIL